MSFWRKLEERFGESYKKEAQPIEKELKKKVVAEVHRFLKIEPAQTVTEPVEASESVSQDVLQVVGSSIPHSASSIVKSAMVKRFETAFEQLSVCGEGGFGTVFKVKHRIEDQLYALKRIAIQSKCKTFNK